MDIFMLGGIMGGIGAIAIIALILSLAAIFK